MRSRSAFRALQHTLSTLPHESEGVSKPWTDGTQIRDRDSKDKQPSGPRRSPRHPASCGGRDGRDRDRDRGSRGSSSSGMSVSLTSSSRVSGDSNRRDNNYRDSRADRGTDTRDNKRRRDDRDTARSFSNKLFGDDPDDGESTAPPNMRPRPF
jgi:hypothetical protein